MTADDRWVLWLRRAINGALSALVVSSTPLWRSQGDIPEIPWFPFLVSLPRWCDGVLLGIVGLATLLSLIAPKWERPNGLHPALLNSFATCQCLGLAGLVALDQQRLQPWMYEFLLLLGIAIQARGATALSCCRAVVISIYFWSGVSKIDPGFLAGHGRMLLEGLLHGLGLFDRLWTESQRDIAAGMMPAAELAIALLLTLTRTRRLGLVVSLLLHAGLLLTLSPLGLNHEPGVLIWNVYFIAQNVILFRRGSEPSAPPSIANDKCPIANDQSPSSSEAMTQLRIETPTSTDRLAQAFTLLVCVLPALNPIGWWDHWPSWSVYSAHPAIVQLEVRDSDIARLPASLQPLVDPARPLEEWRQVRLDQWSFAERRVPPYPQTRWKLALAAAVAERAELGEHVRVRLLERRSWWNPKRIETVLEGSAAIQTGLADTWINTRPRSR